MRKFSLTVIIILASAISAAAEPPLPPGLSDNDGAGPPLPPGLGVNDGAGPPLPPGLFGDGGPELPPGFGEPADPQDEEDDDDDNFLQGGFFEYRGGVRTQRDPHQRDISISELRFQNDHITRWEKSEFNLTFDMVFRVWEQSDAPIRAGRGWFDLRQANYFFTPSSSIDMKIGRQILTWGTGDLLFINDSFPKDYESFFLGRDVEYLKAPTNAIKASAFGSVNLDLVYVPVFNSDRFIDGRRISYWNSGLGRRAGRDAVIRPDTPNRWFRDDEIAARLYKNIGAYEYALYGYRGFWKSPAGQDPATGKATFPALATYGASVRGPFAAGIGNVEIGYFDSLDDQRGSDPFVRNSEARFLVGYEQDVPSITDFTVGVQYYIERMLDYGAYRRNLPPGMSARDEDRHVLTLRLTKLLMQQNLRLSLFTFYSPTDDDAYLRPNINYKITDHWSAELGANVFLGRRDDSFFGQFEKNNNVYAAVRHAF